MVRWGFFCQAEDGIRDAQESRGLGDVYKRQVIIFAGIISRIPTDVIKISQQVKSGEVAPWVIVILAVVTVSYTHLTLPTTPYV
ncbi:hypothetical protein CDFC105_31545 [Clostridioides difficile]|nr:hypothetical protein CDFC105_31545 [Clostridioides difficile]